MNKDLEKKLENMKPKKLNSAEKQILWSKIEGGIDAIDNGYARNSFGVLSTGARFAIIGLAGLIILTSGSFATVSAANASGPGDALFGVDLAMERFQLLISKHDRRAELRLLFAEERLGEVYDALALADLEGLNLVLSSTSTDNTSTSTDDTDTSTSTDGTSTSTDDTSTSTDDTSTSTDDTSTSTDDTSTSTDDTDDDEESDEEQEDRILSAQLVLEVALERLEAARDELEDEGGNEVAIAALNQIIARLQAVAEDHIGQLDKIHARIQESDDGFKIKLKLSSDDLKIKFGLEIGGLDNDGETDIRFNESNDRNSIKLRNDGLKVNFDERTNDDNNGDSNDDEDEDDDKKKRGKDRDRIDRDDRFDFISKKIEICHKGKTIEVSVFARYAHLWHGDEIGACDDEDGHGEDHDDEDDDEDDEDEDDDNATTTDDIAPIISDLSASSTTSTIDITWTTDENSDSVAWYSSSTPITIGSGDSESSSTLVSDHAISLTGLTASTTYYYVVESTDSVGNTATSSEESFITL